MNNCDVNADCADSVGSFACTCNSGYSGNGVSCTSKLLENIVTKLKTVNEQILMSVHWAPTTVTQMLPVLTLRAASLVPVTKGLKGMDLCVQVSDLETLLALQFLDQMSMSVL